MLQSVTQIDSNPVDGLMSLLALPPNAVNTSQSLMLLNRAYEVQLRKGINVPFVEVYTCSIMVKIKKNNQTSFLHVYCVGNGSGQHKYP